MFAAVSACCRGIYGLSFLFISLWLFEVMLGFVGKTEGIALLGRLGGKWRFILK
jgi:hypothetical protein